MVDIWFRKPSCRSVAFHYCSRPLLPLLASNRTVPALRPQRQQRRSLMHSSAPFRSSHVCLAKLRDTVPAMRPAACGQQVGPMGGRRRSARARGYRGVSNIRYTEPAEQLAAINRVLLLHYRKLGADPGQGRRAGVAGQKSKLLLRRLFQADSRHWPCTCRRQTGLAARTVWTLLSIRLVAGL